MMSNIISVIIWIQNLDDHDDDSCQQVHTMVGSVQEMLPGGIARKIKPSFDGTTNSHDPAHITHPVTWWRSQGQFFPPRDVVHPHTDWGDVQAGVCHPPGEGEKHHHIILFSSSFSTFPNRGPDQGHIFINVWGILLVLGATFYY